MGVYTIRGSEAFDARLDHDFDRVARALSESDVGSLCRALVLIGGYGRGEGTPLMVDGRQEPFNDYDFVVVSIPMNRRRKDAVQGRLRLLEQQLSRELGLPVDLQLYPANSLPCAEFSLLNYEMKYGHKTVWGETDVLRAMPDYPHDRIPLSEGTRLLLNRGKLLLDVRRALRSGRTLSADERLRVVKFLFKAQLAFGDCALLLTRAYDLSYAVKKVRIGEIAAPGLPDAGFLVERYRAAIALKEWGDYSFLPEYPLADEFEIVRKYYLRFFRWHEASRLKTETSGPAAYARALLRGPRECPPWKAALLNARTFGGKALAPGAGFLWAHPRTRLYLSLPLLLADDPIDTAAIASLFQLSVHDRDAGEERFYQLQKRFS
jgi:hypothetical protein